MRASHLSQQPECITEPCHPTYLIGEVMATSPHHFRILRMPFTWSQIMLHRVEEVCIRKVPVMVIMFGICLSMILVLFSLLKCGELTVRAKRFVISPYAGVQVSHL